MRIGDIIVNPYVSQMFNGELNPMYATIYIGNNRSIDYHGRVHRWGDKVYKNEKWRVIGHHDFNLFQAISEVVERKEWTKEN